MYPKNYNPNNFISNPGCRYQTKFVGEVLDDDRIYLVESGRIDLWAMHDAGAESCDINNIVARFQNGDISVLQRVQGTYADVSGLPSDLRGMIDLGRSSVDLYEKLPESVKSKFPTVDSWISAIGSREWTAVMNEAAAGKQAPPPADQQGEPSVSAASD